MKQVSLQRNISTFDTSNNNEFIFDARNPPTKCTVTHSAEIEQHIVTEGTMFDTMIFI
jgi:hypothetical protein